MEFVLHYFRRGKRAIIASIFKTFVPVKVDENALFVYSDSEFKREIVYSRINLIEPILKRVTELNLQTMDEYGKRIEVPVTEEKEDKNVEITAKLKRIIFWNKRDYYILSLKMPSGEEVIVVGKTSLRLIEGTKYAVKGYRMYHPKYGNEIKFYSIQPIIKNDIVKFLLSGTIKCIKETTAKNIVFTFIDDTFNVLSSNIGSSQK